MSSSSATPPPPLPLPVDLPVLPWQRSGFCLHETEKRVLQGFPPAITDPGQPEWLIPEEEDVPAPPPGYVVSFKQFHERGLGTPPDDFIRGLLYKYKLELHNLNPNDVLLASIFISVCEGYLGVPPHFKLWRYFHEVAIYHIPTDGSGGNSRSVLAAPYSSSA